MSQFQNDLEKAKTAEQIALQLLQSKNGNYRFEDISNNKEYYYKGDIKATCLTTGQEYYIDVKDDSRIAETRNILCEEENYWKDTGIYTDGFMHYDYDYLAIVSQSTKEVYIIDFKVLKRIYKSGQAQVKQHYENDSYYYILPLSAVKRNNGLLHILTY